MSCLEVVLFDLDGVLVDSQQATAQFFVDILARHGYNTPSRSECDSVYHLPAVIALATLTKEERPAHLKALAEAISSTPYPLRLVKPCAGAREMLRDLAKSYRLGIVTSRIRAGVTEILEDSFEPDLFEVVVGFEDTDRHKPDPAPILVAMERLGVDGTRTAYVGDSESDVAAAHTAGALPVFFGSKRKKCISISRLDQLQEVLGEAR
jgi:pyrophosphatase PpaX